MKILKIGDLHIGAKQDDPWIQHIQRDAIQQAIKISREHGIKTWIQTGDWFDVRKAITHTTMEFNRELCEAIADEGISVAVIVGNHDMHHKNTITPNACTELLSQYNNITVYENPTTVNYNGLYIDLIPWMCPSNTQQILDHIKNTNATHCVGHWELNGFWFYKGLKSHGIDGGFLSKYERVVSGHFHTRSSNGNTDFIGTPYTLTAGDENDPRGFTIFDTETRKYTFVENATMWHQKIYYPATGIDFSKFKNIAVRVIVETVDKNLTAFENELEKVVHSVRIVSAVDNSVELAEGEEIDLEVKSIPEIMDEYVEAMPECSAEDIQAIKQMSKQLWIECTS